MILMPLDWTFFPCIQGILGKPLTVHLLFVFTSIFTDAHESKLFTCSRFYNQTVTDINSENTMIIYYLFYLSQHQLRVHCSPCPEVLVSTWSAQVKRLAVSYLLCSLSCIQQPMRPINILLNKLNVHIRRPWILNYSFNTH